MTKRKKPRTAAQKRATAKLVAFNKARKRLNKRRAAPTRKAPRTAAQKRATAKLVASNRRRARAGKPKRAARKKAMAGVRKARSRGWIIVAKAKSKGKLLAYYYTGKTLSGFKTLKVRAHIYPSQVAAKNAATRILDRLPDRVSHLEIKPA